MENNANKLFSSTNSSPNISLTPSPYYYPNNKNITTPKPNYWSNILNVLQFLIILILLVVIVVLIIIISNYIPSVKISESVPFTTIPYPNKPNLPADPNIWDPSLSNFGLCSVMSAVNLDLGANPLFPEYIVEYTLLPKNYGYVAKIADPEFGFSHVVAIRGTLNKLDWQTDFSWNQVPYLEPGILVHKGFLLVAELIMPSIFPLLSNASSVLFTGHSLGAAVVEIVAATWQISRTRIPGYLYTSGRPRVGNLKWDDFVTQTIPRMVLNNGADDIPQLPPPTMPGRGTKDKFSYLSPPYQNTIEFWYQTLNISENHDLRTYQYMVSDESNLPFPIKEEILPATQLLICN